MQASGMLGGLRDGRWLTADRALVFGRVLAALTVVFALLWPLIGHDNLDMTGEPLGTDFLNVYAAGEMVREGRPPLAYDWPAHSEVEHRIVAFEGYYGWHYPPMFLGLAALLAGLPYLPALGLYMLATLAGYLAVLREIAGRHRQALVLTLGFPATFVCLGHGQNGFLTAALLGLGLLWLDRRPWLAGIAIGLLAYKPQFGLLIPLALLAAGAWRAIAAASATVIVTAGLSALAFGLETWRAFFASLTLTRTVILESGATGWPKIQSVFSAVMSFGGDLPLAYGLQGLSLLLAAVAVVWVWRHSDDARLKGALLVTAIPLSTPYVLDYDLTILALPIALLTLRGMDRGFPAWRLTLLGIVWIAPLIARQIGMATHVIVMPLLLWALMANILAEIRAQRSRVR